MSDHNVPKLKKWPFFFADAILLALACWVFSHYPHPLAPWAAGLITAAVVVAALLAVWPFRIEYETEVKFAESGRITSAVEAIQNLEAIARQIQQATGQWQGVQEHAGRTTQAAREISDRMTAEARAFSEFMTKANDSEKATLRLEIEKLRRGEGQWLQVLVHLLDHVHALYQAGARSGQPSLAAQLAAFQSACRDLVRRVGLVPVEATLNDQFDPEQHDLIPDQGKPEGPAQISQIVATGYSYQGQAIRKPIVVVTPDASPEEDQPAIGEAPIAEATGQEAGVQDLSTELPVAESGKELVQPVELLESEPQPGEFQLESELTDEEDSRKAGNA